MINMDLLFGPVAITLVLGGISILLLYRFSVRHYSYWKTRGVATAKTVPLLGSVYEILLKPFQDIENDRYKELGRIYGHYEGSNPVLSVGEPTLLRDILLKDFGYFHDRRTFQFGNKIFDGMLSAAQGEDWKRIRSIVSPTFSTGKIRRMLNIFKDCARTLCQNFRTTAEAGKYVETKGLYGAFTMDVIASSAFSTKIDSHNDPKNTFVEMAKRIFNGSINWKFFLLFLCPRLVTLFKINVFDKMSMEFFVNVTRQIVDERKKSGKSRNDFLQLLLDTAKEVSEEENWDIEEKNDIATNYGEDNIEQQILKTVTAKHLSMEELIGQCVLFFLAGYHTTAATLSFTTYSLAMHPEIQDKLRKEVDDVLKENNGEMTYEAIQSMKYLDNVISETLRMHSPAVRLERQAVADYELGDTGITIPKGMLVTVPVYAMHRDADFYPEPETFDPDRFTPEERGNRDQYTYLPFGSGPRNCVGMRFALMEIKVCLAHVVANFILKKCPDTKVPMEYFLGQGLLQPTDAIFEVEVRKDSPLVK